MATQTSAPTSPPEAIPIGQSALSSLPRDKPFTVTFDGSVLTGMMALRSVRDIDRLMKVLHAQKVAFEAMQDADDYDSHDPGN